MSGYLYLLLAKNSPYTETINRGYEIIAFSTCNRLQLINKSHFLFCIISILRMQETGLLGKWIETFNPETTECSLKKHFEKNGTIRISLQNFSSAFILLIFGICGSFLVFLVELMNRLFGQVSFYKICHRC
jgi:hypothetical protein